MTDWIELMLGEDDEDEAEDEERPALDGAAEVRRPAPPREDGAEDEMEPEGELEKAPEWKPGYEMQDAAPEALGGTDWAEVRTGGTDWAGLRTDGTDWARRTAEAGVETERPEWMRRAEGAVREMGGRLEAGAETAGAGSPEAARKPDRGGSAALMELYRGAAEGARAPAPALARSETSRTVLERETGGAPGLTVEELDRAVRRDSRRYDGGMSIF